MRRLAFVAAALAAAFLLGRVVPLMDEAASRAYLAERR